MEINVVWRVYGKEYYFVPSRLDTNCFVPVSVHNSISYEHLNVKKLLLLNYTPRVMKHIFELHFQMFSEYK
jgi:hypothetical protein